MKTKQALFVCIILSAALCVCVEAAAPKTSAPARRPVSATNTTTKAKVARYNNVKNSASHFDEMFLVAPATAVELRAAVNMMVARGATAYDLFRFRNRAISDLQYIVSSAMTTRAESPEEHARYHCVYANDLLIVNFIRCSTVTKESRKEAEEAMKEAGDLKASEIAYLACSLGGCVYASEDGDLNKSWECFKKYEELFSDVSCTHKTYFDNWIGAIRNHKDRLTVSAQTVAEARQHILGMLQDKSVGVNDRASCTELLQSISHLSKTGY